MMNFATTQQTKAGLMERLRKQNLTISNHGGRKIYSRNILSVLASIAPDPLFRRETPSASKDDDNNYLDAGGKKAILEHPGITNAGASKMVRSPLGDQRHIIILNAGGLSSDLAPNPKAAESKRSSDVTDLSRFLDSYGGATETKERRSSSVVLPDSQTCVVYRKADPLIARAAQCDTLRPEAIEARFELMHAITRCYLDAAIDSARRYGGKDFGATVSPQVQRIVDLTKKTAVDAKALAAQSPGSDPAKMARLASVQVRESIADVFALLSIHRNGTYIDVSAHANELLKKRVIQSQINSGHDTTQLLLVVANNARSLHETMQMINLFKADPGPGRRKSDESAMNPTGFSQLFGFVIDFVLDEMSPAKDRMLQLQAIEVMVEEQPESLNTKQWLAKRKSLMLSREGGLEIDKVRAGLMEQIGGTDRKIESSDDFSPG